MYSSQVLPEPKKNIQTCQQNMQGLNIPNTLLSIHYCNLWYDSEFHLSNNISKFGSDLWNLWLSTVSKPS